MQTGEGHDANMLVHILSSAYGMREGAYDVVAVHMACVAVHVICAAVHVICVPVHMACVTGGGITA